MLPGRRRAVPAGARAGNRAAARGLALASPTRGRLSKRARSTSRRLVGGAARLARRPCRGDQRCRRANGAPKSGCRTLWAGRESAEFALPPSRLALSPGDVIALTAGGRRRLLEIGEISDTDEPRRSRRDRSIRTCSIVPLAAPRQRAPAIPVAIGPAHALVLDLPMLTAYRSADPHAASRCWPIRGRARKRCGGPATALSFERAALRALRPRSLARRSMTCRVGRPAASTASIACACGFIGGTLASVSDLHFVCRRAMRRPCSAPTARGRCCSSPMPSLSIRHTYKLSRLLRGQAGSEWAMAAPLPAGAPFVAARRRCPAAGERARCARPHAATAHRRGRIALRRCEPRWR